MEKQFIYERLTWDQARDTMHTLRPDLARIIDQISPSKHYGFIKLHYAYGDKILNNGVIQIPNAAGQFIKINDPTIPDNLKKWLSYSPIPVGINSSPIEVFVEPDKRIVPLNVLSEGCIFGLWETFDNPAANYVERVWNMSAGSHFLAFLPSISDAAGYRRLANEWNLNIAPPTTIYEEWKIFKAITQHPNAKCDWGCDVLFFDNTWFENLGNDTEWKEFTLFLYQTAFNQLTPWRRKIYFEMIWESFSLALVRRNLKPTQLQLSLVRNMIDVGHGLWPGVRIATDDKYAPISQLQRVFSEVYPLKNYPPIMVQAQVCQPADNNPLYISMTTPTHLDYAPREKNAPSTLSDMRQVILINETMQRIFSEEDRPIFDTIKNLKYNYFHADINGNDKIIKHTSEIPTYDPILAEQLKKYPGLKYPEKSAFLRGCILISAHLKK